MIRRRAKSRRTTDRRRAKSRRITDRRRANGSCFACRCCALIEGGIAVIVIHDADLYSL